ncbi:Ger(x)C family spore germination protein [Clostridium tyrobutyricum]|uniref:Ger(x)C family spore germination protein n=1 Tax=Clostridium tyrobutyricum TaxID=1519 RepID=UPI001C38F3BE|nr:Ger(x)C family spore germination protein [Clostridium tyrobutyricum]MBV4415671.1 Ger(x)C family spore germination protein [Clostridium tyrobutyricum]
MHKKICFVVLSILVMSIVLTGCYDSIEIDDKVYPILIGIDKGISNKIILTIQYPIYHSGDNNGSQETGKGNINSIEAPSIIEACEMLNAVVSRKITLQHVKAFVFSEDVAVKGIGQYISAIKRYREVRSTVNIIVSRGRAEDFIKNNQSIIGPSVSKMTELQLSQSNRVGYFPEESFFKFYKEMLSTYQQPVAAYASVNELHNIRNESNQTGMDNIMPGKGFKPGDIPIKSKTGRQFGGTAIFDGDKMVGYLDTYETRYYLMVKGKFQSGIVTVDDPKESKYPVIIFLKSTRRPKVNTVFKDGKPIINVNIKMDGDIEAIQSGVSYENLTNIGDLENKIKQFILDGMVNTVRKTQIEYNTDVFGFGHSAAKNFKTIQQWENYNWLKHYKEAKINIELDLEIKRMGTKLNSSDKWSTKGREKR